MNWRINIALQSHTGKRNHNEDSCAVVDLRAGNTWVPGNSTVIQERSPLIALLLCDGVGGAEAGEIASSMAIQHVSRSLTSSVSTQTLLNNALTQGIVHANSAIIAYAQTHFGGKRMGCTIVAAVIDGDQLSYASIGDSRLYLVRGGQLSRLTKDHSVAQQAIDAGLISEEQAKETTGWHTLTAAIGRESRIAVGVNSLKLEHGDILALASDGLTDPLDDATISQCLTANQSADHMCQSLVQRALSHPKSDDNTSLVIAISANAPKQPKNLRRLAGNKVLLFGLIFGLAFGVWTTVEMFNRDPRPPIETAPNPTESVHVAPKHNNVPDSGKNTGIKLSKVNEIAPANVKDNLGGQKNRPSLTSPANIDKVSSTRNSEEPTKSVGVGGQTTLGPEVIETLSSLPAGLLSEDTESTDLTSTETASIDTHAWLEVSDIQNKIYRGNEKVDTAVVSAQLRLLQEMCVNASVAAYEDPFANRMLLQRTADIKALIRNLAQDTPPAKVVYHRWSGGVIDGLTKDIQGLLADSLIQSISDSARAVALNYRGSDPIGLTDLRVRLEWTLDLRRELQLLLGGRK